MEQKKKVMVIGLDSTPPELIFNKFLNELPNIKMMIDQGIHGVLRSCHPPITIPAWMVMVTGRSPEALGLYGFRTRKGRSYTEVSIANSYSVKEKAIWDILSERGKKVCLVGVPPTYPPKPVNGYLVSCFLTPDTNRTYTYPATLKHEVEAVVDDYILDVRFRTDKRDKLLRKIYEMTEKRFMLVEYLIKREDWDFFMFVEMGTDRIQHAFWKFFDKEHHLYQAGNIYETVIEDYYRYLDRKIGKLLSLLDDDTVVLIVSDHGAKRMEGAFCINEWLAQEGYLKLKRKSEQVVSLEKADVDWEKTSAWGWGGYCGRVFLNLKGREQSGLIDRSDYEKVRDGIIDRLIKIKKPDGSPMSIRIFKLPGNLDDNAPDLMVYFDDLNYRSAGTIGHNGLFLSENDTGPDDAVHSLNGIFLLYDPKKRYGQEMNLSIYKVAPTILHLLGVSVPKDMKGE